MNHQKMLLTLLLSAPLVVSNTSCRRDGDRKGRHDRDEPLRVVVVGDEANAKSASVEQPVPIEFVPQKIVDAVMKECPGGKITDSDLEADQKRIDWAFDVTQGDSKFDVKIAVDGKFRSKTIDDEDDGDGKKAEDKD